jgi:RNA polymerase sigma-70 factor (family 1)
MISGSENSNHRFTDPFYNDDFNRLFNDLYAPLCRFCMKFVIDKEAAEDIVQDIFVYLWENWERLASIASIRSYLFTAAKHRSISHLQKPFSKYKDDDRIDAQITLPGSELAGPEELLAGKELEIVLKEALEALPLKCRTIFSLKRFGELSNKEVATKLHISVKTVEAQMTIALRKLTAFVAARWGLILLFIIDRLHTFLK